MGIIIPIFYFKFRPVVQMSFKDISYLELWWPFCSAELNHSAEPFVQFWKRVSWGTIL